MTEIRRLFYCLVGFLLMGSQYAKDKSIILTVELQQKRPQEVVSIITKGMTDRANSMGLSEMTLVGDYKARRNKRIEINWNRLRLQNKEVQLSSKFRSAFTASEGFSVGDTMRAVGDPTSLLEAVRALQTKQQDITLLALNEQQPLQNIVPTSSKHQYHKRIASAYHPISPLSTEFTHYPSKDSEVVETDEGCTVSILYDQEIAVKQTRIMRNGQEEQACSNSEVFYPLHKDYKACNWQIGSDTVVIRYKYSYYDPLLKTELAVGECRVDENDSLSIIKDYQSCPVIFDYEDQKAITQFRRYYTDPHSGNIEIIEECKPDTQHYYRLEKDQSLCTLRHDFALGQSFVQEKLFYKNGDEVVTVSECADIKGVFYPHQKHYDHCEPISTERGVILQYRWVIDRDGSIEKISDCIPEEGVLPITQQICASVPFTHNIEAEESYRNYDYYVVDQGQEFLISSCQQSTEFYPHYYDETECVIVHDDDKKYSQLYAKRFIEVDGHKEWVSSACEAVGPLIPYSKAGESWEWVSEQLDVPIVPSNNNMVAYPITLEPQGVPYRLGTLPAGWKLHGSRGVFPIIKDAYDYYRFELNHSITLHSQEYCLANDLGASWATEDGALIDVDASNVLPHWWVIDPVCSGKAAHSAPIDAPYCQLHHDYMGSPHIDYLCTAPRCSTVSTYQLYPKLLRTDGSYYIDKLHPLSTKMVCGRIKENMEESL